MSTIHSATITVTPAGATPFTAGTAKITVTAVLNSSQIGVPVAFSITNGAYPHAGYTASLSPTSGTTDSTGSASTSFTPSNWNTDATTITATVGTIAPVASGTVTTGPGAPTTITFTAPAATDYLSGAEHGTAPWSTGNWGKLASGVITATVSDSFGNAITSGISLNACVLTAFGGSFNNAGAQSATDSIVSGASCSTTGAVASTEDYYQSGTYGTTGYIQGTETGTYGGNTFTAQGISKNIITSTFDTVTNALTSSPALAATIAAGSSVKLTYQLTLAQAGVPITFFGYNATSPYAGSFVGGSAPFHKGAVSDPANVTIATDSTGKAVATFNVDTVAAVTNTITFKANVAAPIDGTPSNMLGLSGATGAATTGAGPATVLAVTAYFDTAPLAVSTTNVVGGSSQVLYIDISLFDAYGNVASNPGPGQLQINLVASVGALSATTVYINSLGSDTYAGGSGAIVWTMNGAVGSTATLTATGVLNGVSTTGTGKISVVSPNPTLSITSPTATTVYSKLAGVAFSGKVTLSNGYETGDVTLFGVFYKIDSGAWVAVGTSNPFTAVASFTSGLHTISFFANDSAKGTSATTMLTVLVDTAAPTITAPTTTAYAAGTPVVFTIVDTEGDLNATSVTATSNSTATLTTTVTGTNNLGASVTYTVSVAGLPATTGHWSLTLNAKDLAGNAATAATVVVKVTVAFAQSLVVSGTPTSSTVGGYTGVSATYSNQWSSSQNVIVFAVWKNSLGQTVYISAGSATIAAGASQAFFLPEVGLASGSYTVNLSVWTTTNLPVSSQTTLTVTV